MAKGKWKITRLLFLVSLFFGFTFGLLPLAFSHSAYGAEKWPGVDESVVGKFARERGRGEKAPLIDLEGDAQLFAFLIAGAAGGFAAGYWWRMLVSEKKNS